MKFWTSGVTKPSNVIEFQEQKNHQNLSEICIPNAIWVSFTIFFQIWVPNMKHLLVIKYQISLFLGIHNL